MKKYIETRTLDSTKLRSLCIEHDWYTCGTNEEYAKLFARLHDEDGCPENMTTDKLAEIAADIMEHSDITDYTITTVMYELNKACTTYFDEAPSRTGYQVEVPCKIGDDIWWIDDEAPYVKCEKGGVKGIAILPKGIRIITEQGDLEEIGTRYCYLTREDAEKAL